MIIAAQLWRQAEYVRELGGHPADIKAAMVSLRNSYTLQVISYRAALKGCRVNTEVGFACAGRHLVVLTGGPFDGCAWL